MVEVLVFLIKIGVFAFIGRMMDRYVSEQTKQRLRGHLETYWYKFSDLSFSGLGRAELQSALAFSDQLLGPSLFTWRRLGAGTALLLICLVFAYVLGILIHLPEVLSNGPFEPWYLKVAALPQLFIETVFNFTLAMSVVPLVVSICLGFSITKWSTSLALRVDERRLPWAFVALLIFHVVIFALWAPLALIIQGFFDIVGQRLDKFVLVMSTVAKDSGLAPAEFWRVALTNFFSEVVWSDFWGIVKASAEGVGFSPDFGLGDPHPRRPTTTIFTTIALVSYVTYGWRIGFTLVFLVTYVFSPVQSVILEYGAEFIENKKPLFTKLLTAIGALVATVSEIVTFAAKHWGRMTNLI